MKRVVRLNEFFSNCIHLLEGSVSVIHQVRQEIGKSTFKKGTYA